LPALVRFNGLLVYIFWYKAKSHRQERFSIRAASGNRQDRFEGYYRKQWDRGIEMSAGHLLDTQRFGR